MVGKSGIMDLLNKVVSRKERLEMAESESGSGTCDAPEPRLIPAHHSLNKENNKWQLEKLLKVLYIIGLQRAFGRNFVCFIFNSEIATYCSTGDAVVVNPEISSGLPLPAINRMPPPGSRPERYATPATKGLSSDHYLCFTSITHAFLWQLPTLLRILTGNGMYVVHTHNSP